VLWISGEGHVGGADHLYLLLKRQKLFPYSKGESCDGAVEAGQHLRQLCREAWSKQGRETGPYKLSSWHWRQKRFIRKFDKMLIREVGSQKVAEVLKTMGTDLDDWLQACG
jgi:hypothetical protein